MKLMGRRETPGQAVDRVTAGMSGWTDPSRFPIASPWSDSSNLHRIFLADVFGTDVPTITTRDGAMGIPALSRARNLLCSTIARFPLVAYDAAAAAAAERAGTTPEPLPDQPAWITSAGNQGPAQRIVWTVDDLIFYGWSCWFRLNDPDTGLPVDYVRVAADEWEINDDNRVEINGQVVKDDDVTLIPGFHEGILTYGRDAITDARAIYRTVRSRLNSPIPPIDLHQTGGRPLTTTERQDLIDTWIAARQSVKGAVGFSSPEIEVKVLDAGGDQLMVEERNAAAVEMARLVGVHAGLLDATAPKASLNYETSTGRNQEFVDFDLALYLGPIAARLSMDDVSPAGEKVVFDLADFTGLTPGRSGPGFRD